MVEFEYSFKLLLVGNQAVGKTSLLNRYVSNAFSENLIGTAGIDLKKKIIKIDNKDIKILLYDSAGHERFTKIAQNQTNKSDGILIVYDITDKASFESVTLWLDSLKTEIENGIDILIIGNKIDLIDNRVISTQDGEIIANKYNIPFIETSAKESTNVEQAFMGIIESIYKKNCIKKNEANANVNSNNNIQNKKKNKEDKSCCSIM